MRKLPAFAAALAATLAAVLTAPTALQAQGQGDLTAVQTSSARALEYMPRDTFWGPEYWTDPAPATYALSAVGSANLCVARFPGDIRAQVPYLKLKPCNTDDFDQNLEFAPAAIDTPLYPATTNVRWRVNARGECAGIARGVLIGPPRVDFNPCGMPAFTGGDATHRGDLDQHVIMVRTGGNRFRLRTNEGRCWTVQGGNMSPGTQLVMEPCDGRAGQVFAFTRTGPVIDGPNQQAADRFGWMPVRGGDAFLQPDRFRRASGIDMPGQDIASMTTANDRGQQCAVACAANAQCRAFTWVQAGVQGDQPMCWLKNGLPGQVPNSNTVSGILRPFP